MKGLDLTTMDGLTSEGSVTWSDQPMQVLGTMDGDVITVAGASRWHLRDAVRDEHGAQEIIAPPGSPSNLPIGQK